MSIRYPLPLLASLALTATLAAQDDFPTTVLADTPEFYYQFDEAGGAANAADSSTNANDSTSLTNVTFGEVGAIGMAALFNGTASMVSGSTLNPAGDFTMEVVYSPTALNGTQVLMSQKNGGGTGRSNFVVFNTGVLNSYIGGATTNSLAAFQPGAWYHAVISYDADETFLRFYVNGIDFTDEFAPFRNFEPNGGNWVIGAHKGETSQWTTGLIDEAALYDFRLDDPDGDGDPADSRITAHWDALTAAGPVALSLTPADPAILEGASTTLFIQTWGAGTVTLDDGSGPLDITASADEFGVATIPVTPAETTTYTLTASRPGSTDATLQTTVTVNTAPVLKTFTTSPPILVGGGDVTVTWDVANANTVTITGLDTGGATSGSTTVSLASTTTFTLTASNDNGSIDTASTVTVKNPGDPLTFPETVLVDNPLAYYRFEETPGATTIADSAGGDNNSLGITGTTLGEPGALGTAARFDGAGSVLLDFNLDPGFNSFTISLLARPDQIGVPTQHFVAQQDGTGTGRSVFYLFPSGNLTTYLGVGDTQGDTPMLPQSWCHVAMSYDAEVGEVAFYIDGQPAGTALAPALAEFADGNWVLGSHKSRTSAFLNGSIDELAVFDRVLDPAEIASQADAFRDDPEATMILSFLTTTPDVFTAAGGTATLNWKTSATDSLVITNDQDGSTVDAAAVTVDGRGTIDLNPAVTTTYTLTANRAGRPEETAQLTVNVDPPPVIDTFTASAQTVLPGQAVTLSWTTTLADLVEVSDTVGGPFFPAESTVVNPAETTTYTLTASNLASSVTLDVTVEVRDPVTPQLLAFWPFDGSPSEVCANTPTTIVNPGNAIGFASSVPAAIAARRSQSLAFDFSNVSDYVATEFTGVAGTTARSVSFWADIDFSDGSTTRNLFSYGQDAGGGAFVLNANANDVLQLSYRGGAGNSQVPLAASPVGFGWAHICVVWHGQSGDIAENSEIYIDGFPLSDQISNTPINSVQTPLTIGFNSVFGGGEFAYDLSISEFAFYQGELTPAQIESLAGGLDPQTIGKTGGSDDFAITAVTYDTTLQEVSVTFDSVVGDSYAIETSATLAAGSWNRIATVNATRTSTTARFFSFGTRNYARVVKLP